MISLQPGELYVSDQDDLVYTVLGSCVSVCLFDDINCIGGMNHYRLSARTTTAATRMEGMDQYGEEALADLLALMRQKGAMMSFLKAKVFGGASMSSVPPHEPSAVAHGNLSVAHRFLEAHDIQKVSENTGGNFARRILFHTSSGMVLMQPVERSKLDIAAPMLLGFKESRKEKEFR